MSAKQVGELGLDFEHTFEDAARAMFAHEGFADVETGAMVDWFDVPEM